MERKSEESVLRCRRLSYHVDERYGRLRNGSVSVFHGYLLRTVYMYLDLFNTVGTLSNQIWASLFSSIDGTLVFSRYRYGRMTVRFVPNILDWYDIAFKLPKTTQTRSLVIFNQPYKHSSSMECTPTGYVVTYWFTDYSKVLFEMDKWVYRSYS